MPTDTVAPPAVRQEGPALPRSVADEIFETAPIVSDKEMGYYTRALVRARHRIVIFTAGCVLASVLLALVLPRFYTASVVLLPTEEGDGGIGQLGAIASTFGFQVPFGSASQSDLYPVLLLSDRLLSEILLQPFQETADDSPQRLIDILVPEFETAHEQEMRALRTMKKQVVRAQKDVESGVVSLQVTTESASMSADVANRLTALLEKYLVETRQTEGSANRTFLDERLDVVSLDLVKAEEALKQFRAANRQMSNSPDLLLHEDRLRRDVLIQEQIYIEITKQKEIAKIEEVKNTPVLKILDDARAPIRASKPNRPLMVILGCMLGAFAAVSWVLFRAAYRLSPRLTSALRPLRRDIGVLRRLSRQKFTPTSP